MRLPWLAMVAGALWAKGPGVTFSHDIAPILYRHCASCHHAGASAPFPLMSYADAASRAQLIARAVAARAMPPWLPAEPRFANERRLSHLEVTLLEQWAAAGAPEGNAAETPPAPQFPGEWSSGPPDLIAEMAVDFTVPASSHDLYRCFAIPLPRHPQQYIRAIEIRPGNTQVVHHALLFQDITGEARRRDRGDGYECFGTPGFLPAHGLGGWTPGSGVITMLPEMAETLYAGADLVLQVHYHAHGSLEADRTRVGLYFTAEKPRRHLIDIALSSNQIDIPPGERNYKVRDHFTIPVDVDLFGIIPHAHYICRDMLGIAIVPGGTRRVLLHIPEWNFNWQDQYRYPAPVRLPAGTRVEMEFTYDNSEANPRNPNHPPRRVVYGPASTDEMAGLHLQAAPAQEGDLEELSQMLWGKMMRHLGGGIYRRPPE